MNWRTVDMSRESRRDQFAYFQTLSNPYVGVTVQVDVTELAVWCRESGTSFFLAVLYAAVFGLTDTLVSWFNSENSVQMAQYAHTGMRMYFVGYFFAGFNIMAAGYLSAVNRPAEASITSICRGMVAIVACSLVLSAVFGMPGVWAAFPASELLTALLTLFLLRRKERGKA